MKLEYTGPRGHRRVDGRPLKEGSVIDVEGKATIEYLLGLRLNDGEPEFRLCDGSGAPCWKCGQEHDESVTGEYPCGVCGMPQQHDAQIDIDMPANEGE